MKVEQLRYSTFSEAYRCAAGPLECVVITSVGPRILSLRFEGGDNLLYEDSTDFRVGDWRLWGGHRFSVAPESASSYVPENRPCRVVADGRLRVQQELADGLERMLEIGQATGGGLRLRHGLRNCRAQPWHGAPWSITCVPARGRVVAPRPRGRIRFWDPPGRDYATASSPQWERAGDYFAVEPRGQVGKAGMRSETGWLAWLQEHTTLLVKGAVPAADAAYPDGGCNVEVYVAKDYLELELLGPLTTLAPGAELEWLEEWRVLPRGFEPFAWPEIEALLHTSEVPEAATALRP